jgi:hypothetical protein
MYRETVDKSSSEVGWPGAFCASLCHHRGRDILTYTHTVWLSDTERMGK